eukprot:TRINITY_DN5470_c0_g1_i3.p1 TRINITY_DN5470_c0_g1~~TRINITY_DN5470_c0_g1_i3.p1  ORF type:complete len:225 (+),score=77.20 TRINITY_DN5470_c0_g1_i3:25-675(+)
MIRRPPRSTHCISSAASDVYKRQIKDKAVEEPPKRTKQDSNKVSFTELLASAKKSYYEIEREKMRPKEAKVEVKEKKSVSVKSEFLKDAVPRKFRIEEEKNCSEKFKPVKRKFEGNAEMSKKTKTVHKDNNTNVAIPSLVDGIVVRKLRIEKEKEQMLKAKQAVSAKGEANKTFIKELPIKANSKINPPVYLSKKEVKSTVSSNKATQARTVKGKK